MLEISPNVHKKYRCLIDTGSLQSNFASRDVKDDLMSSQLDKRDEGCKVCSPISKVCIACDEQATLQCYIFDDVNRATVEFKSKFKFLASWHINKYDMIIGLPDIVKHNILSRMATRLQMIPNGLGIVNSTRDTRPNFPCDGIHSHPNQKVRDPAAEVVMLQALDFDSENFGFKEPTWDSRSSKSRLSRLREHEYKVFIVSTYNASCMHNSRVW